ncbi:hypothetical protein CH352_00945 [Leptospira hartskeerlii]|uniref:DUF4325 domain-containing protein n=1 Tax=Leptospira hartskeerlii TaxID=2023177 RepID=A0A2M9X8E4_9LEPT|nr:STAS-like domain-containing protein [Leptospira hartskeerlii]PJZ23971.1 hypothetical protein CH357_18525 [Leptospira hartskeerlii]PJZ35235.1 hypothetical protein CH352_00945 [Leptospira hartskeerlii]
MEAIDVGNTFYHRLVNRDRQQGDGKHTAVEFREKFLTKFDNIESWKNISATITFDFKNVQKIGPSFANEAFAYFMKYANPSNFEKVIKFINISKVAEMIIKEELQTGYSKK